jgi:hypothetical protein
VGVEFGGRGRLGWRFLEGLEWMGNGEFTTYVEMRMGIEVWREEKWELE